MIALLKTAERTNNSSFINNYVFQRHVFAYKHILVNRLTGLNILELGCGEGYGMEMIAPYAQQYLAVDKKRPADHVFADNASFLQCNLPDLSGIADNSFDTVICFQVIEHIKNDGGLLDEIKRVLKPGGKLFMTTPNKRTSLTRNPFHEREYLPHEMCALVASRFDHYTVQGIHGNQMVMDYYHENKKSVESFTKYDIFNLQHRLPAFMLRVPYTLLNNLNRLLLLKKIEDTTANIRFNDFHIQELQEDCLDYFVTACKSL
ncbi:methyltransferase family protein [Chitinophaga dinghuensis]|uniref:Methyltransferase family protein n=1 Tax=Chitinophaga dinghuensis TaxID=1539050 RepID=A0A327VWC0_9BACT|nr:class I SAM-dependent methyltransferase [Chitinophaga dinghuensis]RAJ80239.1 methyltransferase family protein [Chitinophaga dinghuensis]